MMYKGRLYLLLIFAPILASAACSTGHSDPGSGSGTESLVIDYNDTDISVLSADDISAAALLNVYFEHASVGSNISAGLNSLAVSDPRLDRANMDFSPRGNPGAFLKFSGFNTRVTDSSADGYRNPAEFDIMMMKLCYIDNAHGGFDDIQSMYIYYRDMMNNLESLYPGTVFVWWTIPLCESGSANADRYEYNQLIRTYCEDNNKVLFDIAAIESHQPDGTAFTDSEGNEALFSDYTDDGGHLNATGNQRVASALWLLVWEMSRR